MLSHDTPIQSEIDLSARGKHQGFLRLPHSVHRSAYGWLPIPVVSIRGGDGPVCLLMAGNHGDEYEGQVALGRLARELSADQVTGQLIILPMANFPAARAGRRTSPIDGGNLNRSFPGNPSGTPTEVIAHYIEEELLVRSDYLLDIHSGGSSLIYLPCAMMVRDESDSTFTDNLQILDALGFPFSLVYPESRHGAFSSSAARRKDALAITTEVAGGGTVTPAALDILQRGLGNYLRRLGVLSDGVPVETMPERRLVEVLDESYYCYAAHRGLFEPVVELGEAVTRGQLAGRIHDPETPWDTPREAYFDHDGMVICKRVPARVERGDCLFHLATDATA